MMTLTIQHHMPQKADRHRRGAWVFTICGFAVVRDLPVLALLNSSAHLLMASENSYSVASRLIVEAQSMPGGVPPVA
jgi:hypothetical protein